MSFKSYTFDSIPWRAENGSELLRDFELQESELAVWQEFMSQQGPAWEVICLAYGVRPTLTTTDPDRMRAQTNEEVARRVGCKPSQVSETLATAARYWKRQARRTKTVPAVAAPAVAAPATQLSNTDRDALLAQYGFVAEDEAEKRAIATRCMELQVFLNAPLLRTAAVSLIQQERHLASIDTLIGNESKKTGEHADPKEVRALHETRGRIQTKIEETMGRLGVWDAPELMRKRAEFSDSIGFIIAAVQDYQGRGDRKKIDGVFYEGEVEVQVRHYDLRPPQYRWDLSLVTAPAAIAGLFDPDYLPPEMPRHAHRRLGKAFHAALHAAAQDDGAHVEEIDRDPEEV